VDEYRTYVLICQGGGGERELSRGWRPRLEARLRNAGNDYVSAEGGQGWGDAGNDQVNSLSGSLADGGSGNDILKGFQAGFIIRGSSGNDHLTTFTDQGVLVDGRSGRRDACQDSDAPTINCEIEI
jgi:hypothetical protein